VVPMYTTGSCPGGKPHEVGEPAMRSVESCGYYRSNVKTAKVERANCHLVLTLLLWLSFNVYILFWTASTSPPKASSRSRAPLAVANYAKRSRQRLQMEGDDNTMLSFSTEAFLLEYLGMCRYRAQTAVDASGILRGRRKSSGDKIGDGR
jgi:hypothetical protein